MCKPTFQKGEPAVVSEPANPAGRHGSREPSYHHVVVTKVGPQWITVESAAGRRWRFDHNLESDQDGDMPEIWKTLADAEAAHYRERAWTNLIVILRSVGDPPPHMTGAEIDAIIDAIKGA